MEPGFLVDDAIHKSDVQRWVAGKPAWGWHGSLKGPLVGYEVITFRCAEYGLLEMYVPEIRTKKRSRSR